MNASSKSGRVRAAVVFAIAVTLPGVLFSLGCGAPPAGAGQAASQGSASPGTTIWRSLGTWSGRGNRQTESFDVTTGALRLRWETRNERAPGAGRIRVLLHSAISGRPLQTIVDRRGTGADEAHLADDPRVSYLVIESEDVDWTATLEEAVPIP